MSKAPKTEPQPHPKPDSAADVLASIVVQALEFRGDKKPSLVALAKLANRGSNVGVGNCRGACRS
jgi:hypothetical protein